MKNIKWSFMFILVLLFLQSAACEAQSTGTSNTTNGGTMKLIIGNTELTATLVQNSSTEALKEMLRTGQITINMRDYGGFEKVGEFERSLPRNDERINTTAGDIILYQGNSLVIFYASNSWSYTRLGRINNVTTQELRNILGSGNVTVTLELVE